jgi:hypothetical protein
MTFNVHSLDMDKLVDAPEADTVVRLMWGLNEMNQLSHLGKLVDAEFQIAPELWKYRDSLTAALTRQRSCKVSEILESVVRPLVANDSSARFPELHAVIESDEALKDLRTSLGSLFYGDNSEEFERHRQIRHRITDHFDHRRDYAILPASLQKIVERMEPDVSGIKRGWLFYGNKPHNRDITRFFVVDDVLNVAWQEVILGIPFCAAGYEDIPEATQVRDFTLDFLKLYHGFASRLIDIYLTKHSIWLSECDPTELLYVRDDIERSPAEQVLSGETFAVSEVLSFLGNTTILIDAVAELYELFLKTVTGEKRFGIDFDENQRPAVFHCIQAMRYSLIMSAVTFYRGHVSDVANYGRRTIELAAFLLEICSDAESAKRWINMGKSKKARGKYKSSFQAYQLVAKYAAVLTQPILESYDNFCFFVHPSYFSLHHQIDVTGGEHRFQYFEHHTDRGKGHLISQLFITLNVHMRSLSSLMSFFNSRINGCNTTDWQESYKAVVLEIEEAKIQWRPFIQAWLSFSGETDEE